MAPFIVIAALSQQSLQCPALWCRFVQHGQTHWLSKLQAITPARYSGQSKRWAGFNDLLIEIFAANFWELFY